MRKHVTSTLARLAERQQEVTRLERALSAALVCGDRGACEEPSVREAPLDAAPVRHQACELRKEAEQLAQDLAAAADDLPGKFGMAEVHEARPPEPVNDKPAALADAGFGQVPVPAARPTAGSETAQAADDQHAMLESLFRFLKQDRKRGR